MSGQALFPEAGCFPHKLQYKNVVFLHVVQNPPKISLVPCSYNEASEREARPIYFLGVHITCMAVAHCI